MEKLMRVKGMVCQRCIATVKDIFTREGLPVVSVALGQVVYRPNGTGTCLDLVQQGLIAEGFLALDDRRSRIILKVKELLRLTKIELPARQLFIESLKRCTGFIDLLPSCLFSHFERPEGTKGSGVAGEAPIKKLCKSSLKSRKRRAAFRL